MAWENTYRDKLKDNHKYLLAKTAEAVEYTDSTSAEG